MQAYAVAAGEESRHRCASAVRSYGGRDRTARADPPVRVSKGTPVSGQIAQSGRRQGAKKFSPAHRPHLAGRRSGCHRSVGGGRSGRFWFAITALEQQRLTVGLDCCFCQPVFIAAQGALADGVASLTGYLRSLARKSGGNARDASKRGDDRALTARSPTGREFTDACYEFDGSNLFFVVNGERIAKRGHPRTPEAGKWLPLRDDVAVAVFELLGSQTTPSVCSRVAGANSDSR